MSKKETRLQVIKKRLLSISLAIAIFLFSTLVVTSIFISIPTVQTIIINKISETVFTKINHKLDLEYINIRWFDTILIRGLNVNDTKNKKMISADRIILDFKFRDLITEKSINFDKAILQNAYVEMQNDAPDGQFNLNFFIDEIKDKLLKKKSNKEAKAFIVDDVILSNSTFKMYRNDMEPITTRFDQYHFTLLGLEANLENLTILPANIAFTVEDMQFVDSATNFNIKELKTAFQYTRQSMVFQNMELKAGESSISQSMVFNYLQPSSVKEFVDSVNITANVKKSIIHSKDLAHFVPSLNKYNEYYRLKGFVEGPIARFNAKDLTLQFGNRSEIQGYFSMYGLPNFEETFINAKINEGQIHVRDLASYLSDESETSIQKFGFIHLQGGFSGFPGDFVSKASFQTDIGNFVTDINLKLGKAGKNLPTYSGKLTTHNFDLGTYLGDTALYQFIDMDGRINGKGFSKEEAKFDLISNITKIGINGYDYQNIKTDAILAEQFFSGNLIIDDPNLQFEGKASIDLNKEHEIIQINANLGKAYLDTLRITNKPAFLSSVLNVDMRGLSLDEILGDIFLNNTYFRYGDKDLYVDQLQLISEKDSLSRSLKVQSPIADLHIFGDFNYSSFIEDVKNVYDEYRLIFRNNNEEIDAYYAAQNKNYSDYYYLDYDIKLRNINPIVNLFVPDFNLSPNTEIVGGFMGGPTKMVQVKTDFDSLTVGNITFENNKIEFSTQKSSENSLVYAHYTIASKLQKLRGKPSTNDLNCDLDWEGNKINFLANINQANTTNYVKTAGQIEFLPDVTNITLKPSEFKAIDKIWKLSKNNLTSIRNKDYKIHDLTIFHEDQKITFNGELSENPLDKLFITVANFDMKNLNPLITKKIDGVFNGLVEVKNFFSEKDINSRINISDFSINEFLVGTIQANSDFDHEKNQFDVQLNVNRLGMETMRIEGNVKPENQEVQLDLAANFTNTNLNLIQPFYEDFISDVSGQLNGDISITGALNRPVINGIGTTNNGAFTLDYLNTHYMLDGQVVFDNNHINFEDFVLTDSENNQGDISGTISHNGFKELEFDFYGDMRNFMVLNTTAKNNNLYYGTAFATGNLRIFGQEKVFNISASATSNKGTKFYIPLDGGEEVVKEDFINFISYYDSLKLKSRDKAKKIGLSGINLNLDLDLTPDAYCEIIFDQTAGDIIRGRGNGKLNLQIDTKGDFYMFGDYEIQEGGYNFTLYNIINKEFVVEPTSKISWIGDPYEAILDIKANYSQLASLTPILKVTEEDIRTNPELNRKYPAKVLLDITGNLMYPQIDFGIDVEGYPKNATYNGVSIETQMTAFQNKLRTDEQELKRQVFSLIILKNFSTENAFNVGGSVERSVSEFISNQISYWVTQFDENLVVDVDLGSMDDEAFNTFQLRMSYSFLNGRLRVTRDGGFTDEATGTNVASILGDWSVEYLLSADGKLRTKIYNRTNFNTLNPNLKSTSTTAGFSLMHTQSFDEIKNIFRGSRDKNRPPQIDIEPDVDSEDLLDDI